MRSRERRAAVRSDRRARLERMIEIRTVEDRVNDLFAQGLVHGTTHLSQGQEGVAVGLAAATTPDDAVVCTYRGHGIALALGVEVEAVLAEILGRARGAVGGLGGSMHLVDRPVGLLPTMAIVGAGIPIAAGAGLAAQVLGTGGIGVAVFGDGATNIGAFHEGLNLASVWSLPVVFVCENNLYGEYSPITLTTPMVDLAERAAAYGIPSSVVDGQDVDAVADAVAAAAADARGGRGPTFLEMKTYRYSGHSRADAAAYRPEGELESWKQRDPILVLGRRLEEEGVFAASDRAQMEARVRAAVEEALEAALAAPAPEPSAMFDHVFAGDVSG